MDLSPLNISCSVNLGHLEILGRSLRLSVLWSSSQSQNSADVRLVLFNQRGNAWLVRSLRGSTALPEQSLIH